MINKPNRDCFGTAWNVFNSSSG